MKWVCDPEWGDGRCWLLVDGVGSVRGCVVRLSGDGRVRAGVPNWEGRYPTFRAAALAVMARVNHLATKESLGL